MDSDCLGSRLQVRTVRGLFAGLASILVGLAVFEVTMQPRETERLELGLIFVLMAIAMGVMAVWLPRFSRSLHSIRWTFGILSIVSFVIVFIGVGAVAERMFLDEHDVTLLLVVLGFGIVSAVGFALLVSQPLTDDLAQLADAADGVARGNFENRVDLGRQDEVGRLADSIDEMVSRLGAAEHERALDNDSRQRFFAAVGHDLRTPLASLQAAIEALRDGVAPDPDRYLASMESEIGVLSSLIEDIYLLARLESGGFDLELTVIDLTELADEAIEVVRPLADRRGVALRLDSPRSVLVTGGSVAMGRVLRNLLDNAVRHSPDGAEVVVAVGENGSPSVFVTDQGPGFPSDFVDRAFDRFVTNDPARVRGGGGSGLGLAIAAGFVAALDGEIWAEPGPGGKVGIRLPA